MKITSLKNIDDEFKFSRGARFRQYKMGLNVSKKEDDYYEYILADFPGDEEHMLMTCVEGYKSGSTLALVKTFGSISHVVLAKDLKYSMGIEDTYYLEK